MRNRLFRLLSFIAVACGSLLCGARPAPAQLSLPEEYGAAGTSQRIRANAAYITTLGDSLVERSVSRATASLETQNSALIWLTTYFERKELNRAYRLRMNPPFLDKEQFRRRQVKRRIQESTELVLKGDVTDELNWIVRELAGMMSAYQLLSGDGALAGSPIDEPLDAADIHHLRLTDGARQGGAMLVFRADAADARETDWPRALRRIELDEARGRFERARDRAVKQILDGGKLGREAEEELMGATDQLCEAFNDAYRSKEERRSFREFSPYLAGKQFLKSLAGQVYRLMETNDTRAFDGGYRFEGGTTVELLEHVNRYGLQFAPPEPGDEGTYRKLFFALRAIHAEVEPSADDRNF